MTSTLSPRTVMRLAVLVSCLLLAALLAPGAGAPSADAAVDPALKSDTLFTAEPLPTWQTNGVVYAIEAVGDVVYVGGNFTAVRPPERARGHRRGAPEEHGRLRRRDR